MSSYDLRLGDCLELLRAVPDGSVDLVLADLPYGVTRHAWDSVIPLAPLWEAYLRVGRRNAAFILTAGQPFSSILVMSQLKLFRHEWIWIKSRGSNFANTVREPMKEHESALVFSRGRWTYHRQMQARTGNGINFIGKTVKNGGAANSSNYGAYKPSIVVCSPERVPSSWQKFNVEVGHHPTQKPVDLMRYLIRTYSDPGDLVLDNAMGSGTTGVAALREGRRFLGMEQHEPYYETARRRLADG